MQNMRKLWTGRVSRLEYFCGALLAWIATLIIFQLYALAVWENGSVVPVLVLLVVVFAHNTCLRIRRWHDIGYSGWMELLCWVPIVSFFAMLYVLFARGEDGENKSGPEPLATREVFLRETFPILFR